MRIGAPSRDGVANSSSLHSRRPAPQTSRTLLPERGIPMLTAETRRRDFPSLEGMAYLNTAAEGIPPLTASDALQQYFRDKQLGMDGRKPHAARWEEVKTLAAEFFGLTPSEVGICSCSSEAYNLAALALRLRDRDEVVVNDLD